MRKIGVWISNAASAISAPETGRQTEVFWEEMLGRFTQLGHALTVREQADSYQNQNTGDFIGTYRPEK
ncbi:MAG: hypothetical protein PHY23_07605 [Oscillospiraceae bacterium]|nr:hypothetical protein [Oscillospiraceae bacterium]